MEIEIDDSIDGETRRDLLKILPVRYAMEKFKVKRKAAKFLGLSLRGLDYVINRYPELEQYRSMQEWAQDDGYLDMLKRYPNR